MPVSTKMGVTAPPTVLIYVATMTQAEMRAFVPPFTTGIPVSTAIPVSPHFQVRTRLDDRFIAMQNFTREQPYGMLTFMMASLHNNASTFVDHENPLTPYNAHSPSSLSIFGRNAPLALTPKSRISLRQQMDESNHEMVNMLITTNWYSF